MPISIINTNSIADDAVTVPKVTDQVLTHRNLIINGAMQVAQRGASFSASGTIYTLDRWEVFTGNPNCTTTQEEFTVGQTDVPHNPTHYINIAKNGETQVSQVRQKIEDVRILSGETVTLSFWANTSSTLALDIFQNFGTGGSTQQQRLSGGSFTIVETNGSWSKYQITNTQSSVSGKTIGAGSYTLFRIVETTATTNDVAVTQVQLEVGDTATPFERRSYGEELARCQRYYFKWDETASGQGALWGLQTVGLGSNYARTPVYFPVKMRALPTASGVTYSSTSGPVGVQFTTQNGATLFANPTLGGTGYFQSNWYMDAEL